SLPPPLQTQEELQPRPHPPPATNRRISQSQQRRAPESPDHRSKHTAEESSEMNWLISRSSRTLRAACYRGLAFVADEPPGGTICTKISPSRIMPNSLRARSSTAWVPERKS